MYIGIGILNSFVPDYTSKLLSNSMTYGKKFSYAWQTLDTVT